MAYDKLIKESFRAGHNYKARMEYSFIASEKVNVYYSSGFMIVDFIIKNYSYIFISMSPLFFILLFIFFVLAIFSNFLK